MKVTLAVKTVCICAALGLSVLPQSRADARADVSADDSVAIKAQTGCYHVTFTSKETSVTDPNYPTRSPDFHEEGIEWITVDNEANGRIELQHVLATSDGPQKHWTQVWRYAPQAYWPFRGPLVWQKTALGDTTGQWAQYVGQVDDSPRYECVAPWGRESRGAYWECETWTPLPRREFSQRSDYNVLERRNRHQLTSDGWVHEQHNRKLLVTRNGNTTDVREIARELTVNTYHKIEANRCQDVEQWWRRNRSVWQPIKGVWSRLMSTETELRLQAKVNGETLWMRLFDLADDAITRSLPSAEIETRADAEIKRFRY